jgi:hypothetical protein
VVPLQEDEVSNNIQFSNNKNDGKIKFIKKLCFKFISHQNTTSMIFTALIYKKAWRI